jgi:isopenicillin-N N-acyltransferase-like protein
MTTVFRSTSTDPFARGREFGAKFADKIKVNIATYGAIFNHHAGEDFDIRPHGEAALKAIAGFAPPLHEEILGMAEGAGIEASLLGALNARTEILAIVRARMRGECSAVIHLPPDLAAPVAVQTWDWYQIFKGAFLVWEIPLADGSVTKTMTEYGIVGKSGLNTRGIGLLFTILHHQHDGVGIGVPVHVAARWTLDSAPNLSRAGQVLAAAKVSASSSLNMVAFENGYGSAMTAELYSGGPSFILPDDAGYIIHTNHFLANAPAAHDTEPGTNPDTLLRRDLLRRRLSLVERPCTKEILAVMNSHVGGDGAVCCHPAEGSDPSTSYETLATIALDVKAGELSVHSGGPCTHPR